MKCDKHVVWAYDSTELCIPNATSSAFALIISIKC